MAFNKVVAALLISMLVISASFGPGEADNSKCFCPCMKNDCLRIKGTSRESCAEACDTACREAGYPTRSGPNDFCGL